MKGNLRRILTRFLAPAALVLGVCGGAQTANAGAFLWISAPTWSYSAAAAASPVGWAYFWALSSGVGSWSAAYAFSNDGAGDAAYAFAQAAAGLGGMGAVQVAGIADPYAGVGINNFDDPSNSGGYPSNSGCNESTDGCQGTNPFTGSTYTVDSSGITFGSEMSQELNGVDALQAFVYGGTTSEAGIESELGAGSNSGSSRGGDVTSISALMADLGLIPLDPLMTDPSSLSSLSFTENNSGLNTANVILVGEGEAGTPEPGAALLLTGGLLGLVALRRRKSA